jgi:anti-sigma-K factor RskA
MQHSELQEQIPLYALGGMSEQEAARLAEHLEVCPACRALLSEYQFVADELLTQVPAQAAPARIGVRLENLAAADARRTLPAQPAAQAKREGFWNKRLVIPRWGLALVLLGLLLLLVAGGALAFMLPRPTGTADGVAQMLAARNLEFVALNRAGMPDDGVGFICLTRDGSTGLLWLYGLDPLDHDHTYQVWLRENGTRVSGGTFRSDYEGRAVAVISAPQPFGSYKEIGITVEPKMGSAAPTGDRVIEGRLD